MKTLTNEQFETIVEKIQIGVPYDFDTKNASVYGILINDDMSIQYEKVQSGPDIYDLLNDSPEVFSQVNNYDIMTFATCGWAAPIDKDNNDDEDDILPPSQHPDKRRVRLLVSANTNSQIGSAICFKDSPDEPVYDYGNATGQLADSIMELMNTAKKED